MYYDNEENSLRFKGMYKMGERKGKGISYYPMATKNMLELLMAHYMVVGNIGVMKLICT